MNTVEQIASSRREYRMKAWYRALLIILGAPAASGGIVISVLALRGSSAGLPLLMGSLFLAFGLYLIALATRSRITIAGNHLEIRGAFISRSAELSEIEGIRTLNSRNGKYTQIRLNNGRKGLTLSNLIAHDVVFDTWMRQIPDLDQRDRDVLLEKISNQQELGATPHDRLAALSQAKTNTWLAFGISVAAAIAANWGIPALFLPFSIVLILTPVVLAVLLHRAPLLYAAFRKKADPRGELVYALVVCSFGLLVRARGIHFVSLGSIGPVIGIVVIAYIAAFYHSLFESSSATRAFFGLLLFGSLYGYGMIAVADAVGDQSPSEHFAVGVLSKHYTTGRSRSYYLVLEPWGPVRKPNNLGVSRAVYDDAEPGQHVCLELRPGRLNAPWYTQVSCSGGSLDVSP